MFHGIVTKNWALLKTKTQEKPCSSWLSTHFKHCWVGNTYNWVPMKSFFEHAWFDGSHIPKNQRKYKKWCKRYCQRAQINCFQAWFDIIFCIIWVIWYTFPEQYCTILQKSTLYKHNAINYPSAYRCYGVRIGRIGCNWVENIYKT